ncbi:methyltransferase domain-containing protein [Alphaproteobacteria bacterium KMM 3653]|uniref:Methyltransferase domain-containing protein n=1 Tax=Harenicola maris TaxID=2841044 RepID=A0AAP2CPE6_9RHOB|nr:methyltransferase domain-containing protein [Harenicola maris]
MHLDVTDLRNFYYRTRLGRVAQRALTAQVVEFWPEAKGQTVAGYGFAIPVLRPYLADARRVLALMPGPQGVCAWPAGVANHAMLCESNMWPLPSGMVDKLICMHALEMSDNPTALLEEVSRVLGPGGRALFIVPNRAGIWSRREKTPFGHGQPYSLGQLEAQLRRHSLFPERHLAALFSPPSDRRFWLRTAGVLEKTGRRISSHLAGGALMVEVSKQVYAPRGTRSGARLPNPLRALEGTPAQARETGVFRG